MFSFQPVIQLKSYLILSRFFRNCYHLIYLSRRPPGRCPVFHRALLSVVARAQPDKKSLPETSARLAFGCRPDAAGQKTLPEISTRLAFGFRPGAARQKIIARNLSAACFRLSLRRGQTKNHCPKSQRGITSMHGFVAAAARALPGFSPRLAFGCRPGAARQKIIARNLSAAFLRCIDLSRRPPGRCLVFRRALLSVVARTRPDKKSLPETSPRLAFGCRPGAARQKIIARNFTAAQDAPFCPRCRSVSIFFSRVWKHFSRCSKTDGTVHALSAVHWHAPAPALQTGNCTG